MNPRLAKVITFGTLLVLGGIGVFWLFREPPSVRKLRAELPDVYAEAERRGIPLTAAQVDPRPPPSATGHAEFLAIMRSAKSQDMSASGWSIDPRWGVGGEREEFRRQLAPLKPVAEQLVALSQRAESLRKTIDFINGPDTLMQELDEVNRAGKLLTAYAVDKGLAGDRAAALAALRASSRLGQDISAQPTVIHGLVKIALAKRTWNAGLFLADIDPAGARAYLNASTSDWEFNPAFHLRGEIYHVIWNLRNLSREDWARPFSWTDSDAAGTRPRQRPILDAGLPRDPLHQAMLSDYLKLWIRVSDSADSLGRFTDLAAVEDILTAEYERAKASELPIDVLKLVAIPTYRSLLKTFVQIRAEHHMMQALGEVVAFRDANRRWPKSLAEAGVEPIPDPNSPNGVAKYSAGPEGVAIWMVGENGIDDGGHLGVRNQGDWAVGLPVSRIARKPQNP